MEAAQKYLRDPSGAEMVLSSDQFTRAKDIIFSATENRYFSNNDLAKMNVMGFEALHNDITASTVALQQEIRAVGNLMVACHEDTVVKLNALQAGIEQVNNNVAVVGQNLEVITSHLLDLRNDFNEYVKKDERTNNVQIAKHDLTQLNQRLESEFGHNKELRRTAVGILQANDLNVRTDTILTRAEELCLQTPNYWLAPALVSLASWIAASRALSGGKAMNDRNVQVAVDSMKRTLNEAYLRECSKTSLFFGLICRRANNISQANAWFKDYISFQNPRKVDHTCIVLLNVYAGGLMGRGAEEQEILSVMASWIDELMADTDAKYERQIISDWKGTCRELYEKARPSNSVYQALPEFAAEAWPALQASMQATYVHRELKNFLERELASKDFAEDDMTLIDSMISDLVSEFDADELPIRREQEYQQLIVDLEGNVKLASALRGIKDDILSETKSFSSVLSDAARNSDLSHASAATHVYALRIQMPQIKKAYEEVVQEYRGATPREIPFTVGDFNASTVDGSNEEEVVQAYVQHVNNQERQSLEESKTGTLQLIALIGGAVALLVSVIGMAVTGMNVGMVFLFLIGAVAGGYGLLAGMNARNKQKSIQQEMQSKRTYGTLVIRKIMAEAATWRREYAANESISGKLAQAMDQQAIHMTD